VPSKPTAQMSLQAIATVAPRTELATGGW
jgi:hypothetical protein